MVNEFGDKWEEYIVDKNRDIENLVLRETTYLTI